MTDAFHQSVEAAILSGMSVSQVERQFGIANRKVRRIKAAMYESGTLPKPVGYCPKANQHENYRR